MLCSSARLLTRASCRRCQLRPPPGRILGYAAVIHLLQPASEMCRTLTEPHTHFCWNSCCQEWAEGAGLADVWDRREDKSVFFLPTALKHTAMSKSTFFPQAQWWDYSQGRQQHESRQMLLSSSPLQLIGAVAHPGTLSFAFECTHFPTLIPPKPLQLM